MADEEFQLSDALFGDRAIDCIQKWVDAPKSPETAFFGKAVCRGKSAHHTVRSQSPPEFMPLILT